jgi:hypothetical protein
MKNFIKEFDLDPKLLNMLQGMRYIFKIENNESDPVEIVTKGGKDVIPDGIFDSLYKQRDEVTKKIEDAGLMDEFKKSRSLYDNKYIFYVFSSNYNYELINLSFDNESLNNKKDDNKTFINIKLNIEKCHLSKEYLKIKNYGLIFYKKYIKYLIKLFEILEKNGNILFVIPYPSKEWIYFMYLLTFFFDDVYLVNRWGIFGKKFKKNMEKIKIIIDIIQNNYVFKCKNMINYTVLINYLKKHTLLDIYLKNILIKDKLKFHKMKYLTSLLDIKELGYNFSVENSTKIKHIIHTVIKADSINILKNKESFGKVLIQTPDMQIIHKMIKQNDYKNGIEIGFMYGLKSMSILQNDYINLISIASTEMIDKNTIKLIHKMRIQNNLNNHHNIYQESKYIVLSKLSESKKKFDFIIINDKNLFDDVLFNFTFANQLLVEGGIIIIMNAQFNPVQLCIQYIEKNILFYKKIENTATMTVFKKIKNDIRVPDFFIPFC